MTETWQPSESDFLGTYGPWRPRTPTDVAKFFTGYPRTWFVAGGWAIEAFTGVSRPHEDCDVSVLRADIDEFRRFVRGRHDVWAAGSGALKPVFADDPARFDERAQDGSEQVWLRETLHQTLPQHPWLDAPR